MTVHNQERGTLDGGRIHLDLPDAWSAPDVRVPPLGHGDTATVSVPVSVPVTAGTDDVPVTATFSSNNGESNRDASIAMSGTE